MISYELAKELNDNGFPQEFKLGSWVCKHGDDAYEKKCQCYGDLLFYNPTLSELIEACGDNLFGLARYIEGRYLDGKWSAYGLVHSYDSIGKELIGDTPEEAVARLWLALNTRQN